MKKQEKDFWISIEDQTGSPELIESSQSEFQSVPTKEVLDAPANRRDFLKYLGFGMGAATLATSCEAPIRKAIPYVIKPEEIVPGIATYYASTFVKGGDFCPVLVKTREGRPIKVEGNTLSNITNGGTSARAQASVLSLYDTNRYKSPGMNDGYNIKSSKWDDFDKEIMDKLAKAGNIRILSNTIMSPSSKKVIGEFQARYPSAQHIVHDPVSASGLLDATELAFGKRAIPSYHFDKANVIVSFNADFLGTWISPIEYANQYVKNRRVNSLDDAKMSRHIQVESHMSLTGSNADNRILVKPSEQGAANRRIV